MTQIWQAEALLLRLIPCQTIPGLQWRHQKFKLTIFLTDIDYPSLKYLWKFKVDIPIHARVTAVQSLENLYTFILQQPCWWAKQTPPAYFPI